MQPAGNAKPRRALVLILVVLMPVGLLACGSQGAGISQSEATLASLEENNRQLLAEMAALETRQADLAMQVSSQGVFLSYLATEMPTPMTGAEASASLEGSVVIEGGTCCVGGTAGDIVNLHVAFQATSPFAEVTEMRVRAGGGGPFTEVDLAGEPWVPLVSSQMYPFAAAINWVGFYVAVQYRDALGNLSPVYTDDISVEGMPPTPG